MVRAAGLHFLVFCLILKFWCFFLFFWWTKHCTRRYCDTWGEIRASILSFLVSLWGFEFLSFIIWLIGTQYKRAKGGVCSFRGPFSRFLSVFEVLRFFVLHYFADWNTVKEGIGITKRDSGVHSPVFCLCIALLSWTLCKMNRLPPSFFTSPSVSVF